MKMEIAAKAAMFSSFQVAFFWLIHLLANSLQGFN